MRMLTAALASFSLFIAPTAFAQSQEQSSSSTAPSPPAQQQQDKSDQTQPQIPLAQSKPTQQKPLVSTKALEGKTVKDTQGNDVGKIEELMVDADSGSVQYAVLASGGILSKERLAIPWETLRMGLGKNDLVVEIDQSQLQKLPNAASASSR
jgi:sporulation protein YlmC with PRC-barrel domain